MKDDDAARAQKLAKEKQAAQQLKDFELQTAGQVSSAAFSILQNSIKQQTDAKLAARKPKKQRVKQARGGTIDKASLKDNLGFDNIKLGHRETELLVVRFTNNKVFEADFHFKPQDDNHAIEYYNSLVIDLTSVYGKGDATKKFTNGFADGDGNEVGALLTGAAEYNTIWTDSNNNAIDATIIKEDNDLIVEIIYQDDALTAQAVKQQKANDKSDY